jgi:hypothetical protein
MHLVKLARILENLTQKAEIAQLVEHATENCGVVSSILTLGTPDLEDQTCGRSSAGRTSPCQGEGHGFESHRPLFKTVADC